MKQQHRYIVRFTEELTYEAEVIATDADEARKKWTEANDDAWQLKDSDITIHFIRHEGKVEDAS